MQPKKRALGRGLEALLPQKPTPAPATVHDLPAHPTPVKQGVAKIALNLIYRNPDQPRQTFEPVSLSELANSIRLHGVLQPIAVMPFGDDTFTLVAGERRWRAAQMAGLAEIPAVILERLSEQEMLECALVENLQRENLSPLEEARAYQALIDTFGLQQDEVADRVGKSRPAVGNTLRLLKLEEGFRRDVDEGRMSAGHARAILSLTDTKLQHKLRDMIVNEELTVRQAEERANWLVRKYAERAPGDEEKHEGHEPKSGRSDDPDVARLREQLIEAFACRVDVKASAKDRGKIEIFYDSLDELERILSRVKIEA